MEKITSVAELKSAIRVLEDDQAIKEELLKEQFFKTYESFKPAKLLGATLKEMIVSPNLIENVLDTTVALASGYLTRKIVVGASSSIIRKILGSVLQVGVSKLVANKAGAVKSIGLGALRQIFRKKKANPGKK